MKNSGQNKQPVLKISIALEYYNLQIYYHL